MQLLWFGICILFIPVHTITLDNSFYDWPNDTSFNSSFGTWYIAWENNDFFVGLHGISSVNLIQTHSIDVYFNTDPNADYFKNDTTNGTTTSINTGIDNLPFHADYCLSWNFNDYTMYKWQNSNWTSGIASVVNSSNASYNTAEIRMQNINSVISQSDMTNVLVRLVNNSGWIISMNLPSTNSFTFPLLSNVPGSNFEGYWNSLPSVTVGENWLGYSPYQSNSTVIINDDYYVLQPLYCTHLVVADGVTVTVATGSAINCGFQSAVSNSTSEIQIFGAIISDWMYIHSPARVSISSGGSSIDGLRFQNPAGYGFYVEFTGNFTLPVSRVEIDSSVTLQSENNQDIFQYQANSELVYWNDSQRYFVARGAEWRQNALSIPEIIYIRTEIFAAMNGESNLVANNLTVEDTFYVDGTCSNCSLVVNQLDITGRLYVNKNIYASSISVSSEGYIHCSDGTIYVQSGSSYHTFETFQFILQFDLFGNITYDSSSFTNSYTYSNGEVLSITIFANSSQVTIQNLNGSYSDWGSWTYVLPSEEGLYEISMRSIPTGCLMKGYLQLKWDAQVIEDVGSSSAFNSAFLLLLLLGVVPLVMVAVFVIWRIRKSKLKQKDEEVELPSIPEDSAKTTNKISSTEYLTRSQDEYPSNQKAVSEVSTKPGAEEKVAIGKLRAETFSLIWEIDFREIKILKELGRGAFGVVYLSRWRNTECVVKQLDADTHDSQSVEQFLKEANNVKNLRKHPNICHIFGICIDPVAIVMEYLPDGSLDKLLYEDQITITPRRLVEFAKMIASGMSHLHAENLIHCDLACRNILVEQKRIDKYVLKIADFGLSRILEANEYKSTNNTQFPIRWTAPETLRSGKITRSSDVWSFAVTIWEIAEAKRPYPELSNTEVFEGVCDLGLRPTRPQRVEVVDDLWNLMQRCWTVPGQRPSFNTICDELDTIEEKYFGLHNSNGALNNSNTTQHEDSHNTEPTSYSSMAYSRRKDSAESVD